MHKLSTLIVLVTFFGFGQSDWRSMMNEPDANFFQIQQSFYDEFGEQPGPKGSGWKQFKRWEYYYQNRVDENGNFPSSGNVMVEMEKYYNLYPPTRNYLAGSGNWQLLGPVAKPANGTGQPNGNGRTTCIAFHPTDANTIFVGSPSGGFWKSTDNGTTWTNYLTGMVRLGVSSIAVHPSSPNTIFIGTGDRDGGDTPGYGVWKSTDGGVTWAASNTGMGNRTVYEVLIDPSSPNTLIASTNGARIYRSTDGGLNWTFTSVSSSCKDLAFHPTNANIVYATGTTVERSTNNGSSFTQITSGVPAGVQRIAVAVSANQPNWVYILAGDGAGLVGIYRSTDSGVNYSTRTTTPNILGYGTTGGSGSQAWYDLVIAADPTNANIIYTGGVNIWKSVDGGSTMTLSAHWTGSGGADDVHADHHALDFSPLTNNLYNGNDGGLYITADGGVVWNELSSGLYIAQLYKLGVSQQTFDKVINGYQDNGTGINVGTAFTTEIGGDGMECIIDPTNDTYMYGALYYGDIRRSTNGGTSFSAIAGGIPESGGWVTPYKLDPNNPNRMFAGFDNVWRNDAVRTGTTWTQVSNFGGTSNLVDLAVAPSNSDVMYVSRSNATTRFLRTSNATTGAPATWTNLTGSLPVASTPKDIEIDPADPTHLFVAIGNDIYESTNSGASWTNFSGTLPNISLNTIVIDVDSPIDAMYVGMDVGVYYRDNTMSDWVLYSTGLPNVEITELEIHYNGTECKSTLYAASYGQGLWKSDLKDPGNVSPVACFEANATAVCMGDVVTFTDNTSYTPTSWTWTITPATYSYTGGTNASSQNPQIIFSAAGTYNIQLQATNGTGSDVELKNTYITVTGSTVASAFNEDFESEPLCGTATDCAATLCPLVSVLWANLTNGVEDNIDWRVDENGTASANTGPTVDFSEGTAAGNYAYLEASGGCNTQTAILQSTCIDLDQDYSFDFGYHMYGNNIGSLHVDINTGGVWTQDIMTAIVGNQGNSWLTTSVNLAGYTGQTVKLRIRGITGNGFESDIAIDDIQFTPTSPLPATLTSFEATKNEQRVDLTWQTITETNVDKFIIERSNDTHIWNEIVQVQATGNSQTEQNYMTEDIRPLEGTSYYRLKTVDFDGQFGYSDIRSVTFGSFTCQLYPNPANDFIVLAHDGIAKNNISISNVMGQRIYIDPTHFGENKVRISTSQLTNGVYFVRSTDVQGKTHNVKFTVKR